MRSRLAPSSPGTSTSTRNVGYHERRRCDPRRRHARCSRTTHASAARSCALCGGARHGGRCRRGAQVFQRACAVCAIGGKGGDLVPSRDRAPSAAAPVAWRHPAAQPVDRAEAETYSSSARPARPSQECSRPRRRRPSRCARVRRNRSRFRAPRFANHRLAAVVDARRSRQARDAGGDGRSAGVSAQVAMAHPGAASA